MNAFISVNNVSYTYPTAEEGQPPALKDVSLRIREGEYVAIVGANGSGKSTLARHLNALLVPTQGDVQVAGRDTRDPAHHPEIRRTVGMVFQRPEDQIVATLVLHDVAFGPENLGLPQEEIRSRVQEALKAVGLWDERQRPPHMLSAGQLQRLALAGVLAMRPQCIVFDEVTTMLDPAGRHTALSLMRRLHDEGLTVVAITHLMAEALDADRVIALHEGRLVLEGTPREVFSHEAELRELGLDAPPVTRLASRLSTIAPDLPSGLLWPSELIEALDRLAHCTSLRTEAERPPTRPRGSAIIQTEGLGHTYMRDTPFARRALHDISLNLERGGSQGLMGATGSGKTTLLQHLNGLLRPQEGTVRVADHELGNPQTDLRAVRRMVGLVFQTPETQIFEQYVGDEIAYGPRLAGLKDRALRERVRWAMSLVGLDFEAFKDRFTFTLSGGEQRKVALASVLALHPQVLLLDEPTAGLDPGSRRELLTHLKSFRDTGMTLLLSSHQMEDIAELCENVTVMAGGTTVFHGAAAEVFAQDQRLRSWDLAQPTATQIADGLRSRGWPLPNGVVKEAQLIDLIHACLKDIRHSADAPTGVHKE
ncbi:MAG: energy-coupling factor transporter ATPase [Anaerolineae bacterium]